MNRSIISHGVSGENIDLSAWLGESSWEEIWGVGGKAG